MSHLTEVEVKLTDRMILSETCEALGFTMQHQDAWAGQYSQKAENCEVIKDASGKVCLVVDQNGTPMMDPYYMGNNGSQVIQNYVKNVLRQQASMSGNATFLERGVDTRGNLVVSIISAAA
jgi:hypothetical protein